MIVGILCGLEACFIVECAVGIYGIVVVADVFVCEKRIGRAVRGADISLSINERGRSRNAVIIRLLYRLGYAADYDLIALVIVAGTPFMRSYSANHEVFEVDEWQCVAVSMTFSSENIL